jgi:hypothetical protein
VSASGVGRELRFSRDSIPAYKEIVPSVDQIDDLGMGAPTALRTQARANAGIPRKTMGL